jgi:anti-anti-sigma factor
MFVAEELGSPGPGARRSCVGLSSQSELWQHPRKLGGGMDWELERSSRRLVGRPRGRVDETTWEAFSQHLTDAVRQAADAGGLPLVVDLAGLDYMSSRGLRALTMAKREAGDIVKVTLAAPNDRMREILAISRYDKLFEVTAEVGPDA